MSMGQVSLFLFTEKGAKKMHEVGNSSPMLLYKSQHLDAKETCESGERQKKKMFWGHMFWFGLLKDR